MSGTLQHIRTGSIMPAIPSNDWNAFVDTARWRQESDRLFQGLKQLKPWRSTTTVNVKNSTGSDLARWGILGLGDAVITPTNDVETFQDNIILDGQTPAATHRRKFVVLPEPVETENIVETAVISGVTQCKIDVIDANHEYADIKSGYVTELQSQEFGGAQIMWKESGTGVKWAIVRLGIETSRTIKIVLDVDCVAGSSATASVWKNGADSGTNKTVHLNWMHGGQKVSASKQAVAQWFEDEDKWIIIAAECE